MKESLLKMGNASDYPTVVIGAGLGGLCCGSFLAQQGIPVTIAEQHTVPGGYATSFTRDAFTFDVSLHGTAINNNTTASILDRLGVLEKLRMVQLPELYSICVPGKPVIPVPQRDPEAYIALLTMGFPSEAEGIRGFVSEMIAITDETDRMFRENPSAEGILFMMRFPFRYGHMWKVRNKTLADLLSDYVKDPVLKEVLSALWIYYGLPPDKLSGFFYATATGDYLKNGSFYIRERSQDLSSLLAASVEKSGGKILYGKTAEKIVVENGAVRGVKLTDGTVLSARAVVSNASAVSTFSKLLAREDVPPGYLKKIGNLRPGLSSFTVWLGLSGDIRKKFHHAHVYTSDCFSSEGYRAMLAGDIEKMPFGVSFYDNVFDGYSRPGTSTVGITTLSGYEPWRRFEADYNAGHKEAYNAEKTRWADILIRRAENLVMPGLASMITVREAATPLTNVRYTGNTGGAIYGFDQSMDNSYMTRLDNRTPVEGLYLASAWSNPGGGFAGAIMSGQLAFLKMMEDWGG